jgi:hypothetical protein
VSNSGTSELYLATVEEEEEETSSAEEGAKGSEN